MAKRKERPPKDSRPKEKRHRHGGRKGRRGLEMRAGTRERGASQADRDTVPPPKLPDSENRE